MRFLFFNAAGTILFERSDLESGSIVHEEMNLQCLFPYDSAKVIQRGMRIGYTDALGVFQVYEIRKVKTYEPDHYQEITAEHIVISELTDEFFADAEWTNKTAAEALALLLTNTQWQVGTNSASGTSSASISNGNVWSDVRTIEKNWNVRILPRVMVNSTGITGRYLDIETADGTWRGVRLSLEKNADEMGVIWDDSKLKTALYAFGKTVEKTVGGQKVTAPVTFEDVVWTQTADHPAKPAGQAYLEDAAATAAYGRNGRARFAYYQNGDISDPEVLLQKTWESLKTLNHPDVTIDCLVCDLYRLGYKDTPLRLYDTALIEIRPTGEVLTAQIIQYTEDLLDPTQSRVSIGTYIPNIIYINKEANKGSRGGGGGGQSTQKYEESTFRAWLQINEVNLAYTAAELQQVGGTVASHTAQLAINNNNITALVAGEGAQINPQTGKVVVDAAGEPIFVSGKGLYSKIEQNSTAITLKVSKGDVATQLTVECGNVHVSGGDLVVDGYVTSTGLASAIADIDELYVNDINADGGTINCENLYTSGTGEVNTAYLEADSAEIGALTINNVDVGDAVNGFGTPTVSGGQVSIPYTTISGGSGTINFNKAAAGTITGINQRQTAAYSTTDKEFTVYATASGTDITNSPYDTQLFVSGSAAYNHGHNTVTGTDIDLNGSSSATSANKPTTATSKTGTAVSGYVWLQLSNGTWKNLRSFSLSTGLRSYGYTTLYVKIPGTSTYNSAGEHSWFYMN